MELATGELITQLYDTAYLEECDSIFTDRHCPGAWAGDGGPIFESVEVCRECAELLRAKCERAVEHFNLQGEAVRKTTAAFLELPLSITNIITKGNAPRWITPSGTEIVR